MTKPLKFANFIRDWHFRLLGLALSLMLTVVLIWGASESKRLDVFHFTLRASTDLTLACDTYVVQGDGNPRFDFRMESSNPNYGGLYFWIRPVEEPDYYLQGTAAIVNGEIFWPVGFGSSQWPVTKEHSYSFKVTTDPKGQDVSAFGDVDAQVYVVSDNWILWSLFISSMASFLQFFAFIGHRGQQDRPTTPPNAQQRSRAQ